MEVKKIVYYYFTGTGHTAYLGKRLQTVMAERGVEVTLCEVTNLQQKAWEQFPPEEYDLVGFGYPIHAFTTPKRFDTFVKNFQIQNKPFFILKNSREALALNNASSRRIVKYLTARGCTFVGEKHILLPYDIHFRHPDELVKLMLQALEEKLPPFCDEILKCEAKRFRCHFKSKLTAKVVGGTLWWGTKLVGRTFKPTNDCISCGLCAKNCPAQNILMVEKDGKVVPKFGKECMLCMRCVMHCPKASIKIGHWLKGWEVYGKYDFKKIAEDDTIPYADASQMKGAMARSYKDYFTTK